MNQTFNFKKKLIATTIASLTGFSGVSLAQEMVEEVVVRGVRAAQVTSVNIKRNAASVVDGISAEDIGKLPDVTISDSLQRIPGVQIRRSAGEGSSINVRGLPQVVTQLNGEQYLQPGPITPSRTMRSTLPATSRGDRSLRLRR